MSPKSTDSKALSAPAREYDEVFPTSESQGVLHRDLTVIEVADPNELTSLLQDARVAELVLARIGPTAAVVDPVSTHRLLMALQKAGHTPTVDGD